MKHLKTVLDYYSNWSGKGENPANGVSVTREEDMLFIYAKGDLIMDFCVAKYSVRAHWLEMAVRLLKLDNTDEQYESAVGQIRGYVSGSKGEFFGEILQGIALTRPE